MNPAKYKVSQRHGRELGPLTAEQVAKLAKVGDLSPIDLVAKVDGPWRELRAVKSYPDLLKHRYFMGARYQAARRALSSDDLAEVDRGQEEVRRLSEPEAWWAVAELLIAAQRLGTKRAAADLRQRIVRAAASLPGPAGAAGCMIAAATGSRSSWTLKAEAIVAALVPPTSTLDQRFQFLLLSELARAAPIAIAMTKHLWDTPDCAVIRSALQAQDPRELLAALQGATTIHLEDWLIRELVALDIRPKGSRMYGLDADRCLHLHMGGSPLDSEVGDVLVRWLSSTNGLTFLEVRDCHSGIPRLVGDCLEDQFDINFHSNRHEFEYELDDETLENDEVPMCLAVRLTNCTVAESECTGLLEIDQGFLESLEMLDCVHIAPSFLTWMSGLLVDYECCLGPGFESNFDFRVSVGDKVPSFVFRRMQSPINLEAWRPPRNHQLRSLTFVECTVIGLSDALAAPVWENLGELCVEGCNLSELNLDPSRLPSLKTLDLSRNRLASVQGLHLHAHRLETLTLSGNRIGSLRLMDLHPGLKHLSVEGNPLETVPVPQAINSVCCTGTNITSIEVAARTDRMSITGLSIPDSLRELPRSVLQSPNLCWLHLGRAPALELPPELLWNKKLRSISNLSGEASFCAPAPRRAQELVGTNGRETFDRWRTRATKSFERTPPLRGHEGHINGIAFSRDGTVVATVGKDRTLRRWDVATGEAIGEPVRVHRAEVFGVAFSPDGRIVATCSEDETIRIWDAETGLPTGVVLRGFGISFRSIAFSPDGRLLVSCGEGGMHLWSTEDWSIIGDSKFGGGTLWCVAFSPDGRTIASCGDGATVQIWSTQTRQQLAALVHTPHLDADGDRVKRSESQIRSLAFSPDGRTIACGTGVSGVRLWDIATQRSIGAPLECKGGWAATAFSPNGRLVAGATGDRKIRIWDTASGEPISDPLRGHGACINCLTFSPDSRVLASGSDDETVRLWDVESICEHQRRCVTPIRSEALKGHRAGVVSIAFDPAQPKPGQMAMLVSGSSDGVTRVWHRFSHDWCGGYSWRGSGAGWEYGTALAVSSGGEFIATVWTDGGVRLYNTEDLEENCPFSPRPAIEFEGPGGGVTSIAFSPDGKSIVTADEDGTVRHWDTETGDAIGEPLCDKQDSVSCATFSPDGKSVVSVGADNMVHRWNADTGEALGPPLQGHEEKVKCLAVSRDGAVIVSGAEDGTVRVWEASTGNPVGLPLRGHSGPVFGVAISPDGRTIASGGVDKTVRLWDVATRQATCDPLRGHSRDVTAVAFSPNGETLASASDDCTVRVWTHDLAPDTDDSSAATETEPELLVVDPSERLEELKPDERLLTIEVQISPVASTAGSSHSSPSTTLRSSRWVSLKVHANGSPTLPPWCQRLQLISLHLDGLASEILPDWVAGQQNLRSLVLGKSSVATLPEALAAHPLLESFQCDSPLLRTIPTPAASQLWPELRSLDLSDSGVQDLPEQLGRCAKLNYLNLGCTKLTHLPEAKALTSLMSLTLARSRIAAIPAWIGGCSQLTHLDLAGCPITAIPECIIECGALEAVVVSRDAPLGEEGWAILKALSPGVLRVVP